MEPKPIDPHKGVRFYLRYKGCAYRAFKIVQGANLDINISSKSGLYIPQKIIDTYELGENIEIESRSFENRVHHYTVHSSTGQRHVKETSVSVATDPIIGHKIKNITSVVPLLTCVVPASNANKEGVLKEQWFGLDLPDDSNYAVIDIYALPKGAQLKMEKELGVINNDHSTREVFSFFNVPLRNCSVVIFVQTTNHLLTDLEDTLFFQKSEGKTMTIKRVEKGKVLATITNTIIGTPTLQGNR